LQVANKSAKNTLAAALLEVLPRLASIQKSQQEILRLQDEEEKYQKEMLRKKNELERHKKKKQKKNKKMGGSVDYYQMKEENSENEDENENKESERSLLLKDNKSKKENKLLRNMASFQRKRKILNSLEKTKTRLMQTQRRELPSDILTTEEWVFRATKINQNSQNCGIQSSPSILQSKQTLKCALIACAFGHDKTKITAILEMLFNKKVFSKLFDHPLYCQIFDDKQMRHLLLQLTVNLAELELNEAWPNAMLLLAHACRLKPTVAAKIKNWQLSFEVVFRELDNYKALLQRLKKAIVKVAKNKKSQDKMCANLNKGDGKLKTSLESLLKSGLESVGVEAEVKGGDGIDTPLFGVLKRMADDLLLLQYRQAYKAANSKQGLFNNKSGDHILDEAWDLFSIARNKINVVNKHSNNEPNQGLGNMQERERFQYESFGEYSKSK
jgi:hypothetical protein